MRSNSTSEATPSIVELNQLERLLAEKTDALSQALMQQREAEGQLRLLVEVIRHLSIGVVIMDADFCVTSVNDAYCAISGKSEEEILGKRPPFEDLIKEYPEVYDAAQKSMRLNGAWESELWGKSDYGEKFAIHISITSIIDQTGRLSQYGAIISDVTQRKKDEEHIRYQANFDTLTGLPNRALFVDRLEQSLAAMARADSKLALLFIDLDGFKLVNDTLGHDKGDDLLNEAGRRIASCTRGGDTVARLGGDEFTVIMPNLHDARDAPVVAQRILDALTAPFVLDGTESFVSGSIGITIFPDDAKLSGDLLKNADAAMYRAKELGKANYQFFTADLNEQVVERLSIKNGLIKALERKEFDLYYQPKLSLRSGNFEGVEALMRWDSPDLGMVSPARFIPVLEETGMVVEVGAWAIQIACAQHQKWVDAGLGQKRMAVNLSARQLREMSFVSVLQDILQESNMSPEWLEIEITESMLMSDTESAISSLNVLHDMGIHVAMDDFGTGYSSLSYLKRFPIDTIKIDQAFVAEITSKSDDAEIIRTIINMGKTLRRQVVAEGVETEAQLALLKEYGCDQVQGYLLSRPVPGDALTEFFRAHID